MPPMAHCDSLFGRLQETLGRSTPEAARLGALQALTALAAGHGRLLASAALDSAGIAAKHCARCRVTAPTYCLFGPWLCWREQDPSPCHPRPALQPSRLPGVHACSGQCESVSLDSPHAELMAGAKESLGSRIIYCAKGGSYASITP